MVARRRLAVPLLFVALVVGSALRLWAVSPCASKGPMTCCGGDESGAPAPCGCSLSAATPSPAVVESASTTVALAETPAAEVVVAPAETTPFPARSVTPCARAAPLFVLFAAFLN
jgi:hypothetical protein